MDQTRASRYEVGTAGGSHGEIVLEHASAPYHHPRDWRRLFSGHDLRWSAALALVLAVQAGWFAASTSGTTDETAYLRNGFSIYRHGDFSGLPGDGIAPLSVLLSMAAPAALDVREYAGAIRIARASAIALFGIPLVLLTYATLLGAYGRAAAVTGAALIALSPNMIAHAALATTDVCFVLTALMALYALILLRGRTNARSPRLAGCGAEPCPCREVPRAWRCLR